MPLHLLRDRIQVLPDPVRDDVSSAGILIAASKRMVDSRVQFGRKGTVISVGADIDTEQLKPGDVVLWGEFNFPEYREGGATYAILQDKDLTGVMNAREIHAGVRPLHDRIVIQRLEAQHTTSSGIVLAGVDPPAQGDVLAVGPGARDAAGKRTPLDVKVGDRVMFGKNAGQTVKVDGDELLVMREDDVLAIVEAPEAV